MLISTGAQERPVPIPGWTLPGVMGAAAADVLLKSSGAVPSGRVVIAGSGPLMWLAASRFAETEVNILAVLETVNFSNYLQALPYLPQALRASEYLIKGYRIKISCEKLVFQYFLEFIIYAPRVIKGWKNCTSLIRGIPRVWNWITADT
ncbi:MAG: hypothetical protein CM1200mP30_08870 [Pseudomonadota bacterium]|nr:MAG: hypothetical protein CM1200mP30_08870 [Pseudomonadota bacterium]